jgi:hypothetical protein
VVLTGLSDRRPILAHPRLALAAVRRNYGIKRDYKGRTHPRAAHGRAPLWPPRSLAQPPVAARVRVAAMQSEGGVDE